MHHPFLSRLRDSIQDLHDKAQDTTPLDTIVSRSITPDEYVAILGRLYGFVAPLESLIASNLGGFALDRPYAELMRAPDLHADLLELGVTEQEIDALPRAPMPLTTDIPTVLGMLYLMEGSRMGGIVIARSLENSLDLQPEHGLAYFSSRGKDPHAIKDEFFSRLVSWVLMSGEGDAVIAGAQDGFRALNAWMDSMHRSK